MYKTLFSAMFNAHYTLKHVKALRKILLAAPLQVPKETLLNHSNLHCQIIIMSNENKIPSSCLMELKTPLDRRTDKVAIYAHNPEGDRCWSFLSTV